MLHPDRDGGFTLIEVLVAISLIGMMAALALGGYSRWTASSAHIGTAREMQTTMRQAQQQAVTEGRATCVFFDVPSDTYTVYRGACASSTKQKLTGPHHTASDDISLSGPSFAGSPGPSAGVTFYARGTADTGRVTVTRSGSTKVYRLTVEGLTGRVSLV
jgi:prepilin-type N-terminal cleavage/methylation domain-containing protein